MKIPDHVSYQAAALAEPLAVCLHAVARAGNIEGKRGIIFGAGPIGLADHAGGAPRRHGRGHGGRHRARRRSLSRPGSAPIMSIDISGRRRSA